VPMGYVIASIHEKRDEFRKILQVSRTDDKSRGIREPTGTRMPKS